jgi:hypothetical protein
MLLSMKNNFNWYPFMNHVAWHGLNGRKGKKKERFNRVEWNAQIEWYCMYRVNAPTRMSFHM